MTSENPWEAGYAWGYIVGYIIGLIVITYFSAGGGLAARVVATLAKILGKAWIIIMRILAKMSKLVKKIPIKKLRKLVKKSKTVVAKVVKIAKEITPKTIKHIFEGEINKAGKATGVHHIDAIRGGTARIVPGTVQSGPNGLYKAIVEVKDTTGKWIRKSGNKGYSSFFPDNWDKQKVLEEITHAFNNKVFDTGNTWKGLTSNGIEIEMYIGTNGEIISAFPKF
jgi:Bacterial EndoU nuclease